jgi:hypothetical protein
MKNGIIGLALLGTIISAGPTGASPFDYKGPGMSGYATNALVKAYEASGFDTKGQPPFELQPYVVTVDRLASDEFDVTFSNETTTAKREAVVDLRTGVAGSAEPQSTAEATEGIAIPGISAGAIIVAYRAALKEGGYLATRLPTGAYNLAYYPYAGGTYVAFIPLERPPVNRSTRPAPTPTFRDGQICLAGDCDSRIAYYVTVKNGLVQIREQHLL